MRTGSKQKLKYVIILEILRQETDADHPMQTNTLLKKLQEQGIECSRETLYSDIKALNENGFEIFCNRSSSNEYYIEDRSFDVPEIRILIDAVNAASFITPKKTDELVGKVAVLGGSHRGEIMKSETKIYNTTKHSNEYIYYNINEIELAINQRKKVSFYYFDYNEKKEKVFRKDKKRYYINPYAMLISTGLSRFPEPRSGDGQPHRRSRSTMTAPTRSPAHGRPAGVRMQQSSISLLRRRKPNQELREEF